MLRRAAAVGIGVSLLVGAATLLCMTNPTVTFGSGAPSLIQSGPIVATPGTAPVGTLPVPSKPGNALIAVIANAGSNALPISVPTGWVPVDDAIEVTLPSSVWVYAYYNNPGGISAITFTFDPTFTGFTWYVLISEWANVYSAYTGPATNLDTRDEESATAGTTLTLNTANLTPLGGVGVVSHTNDLVLGVWLQHIAVNTATFSTPPQFTRLADNGSSALADHIDIEYLVNPPAGQPVSTTLISNRTTLSAAGVLLVLKAGQPTVDQTAYLEYGSLTLKRNTFDLGLILGGKYLLEDGSGFYLLEDSSGDYLVDTYVPQLGDPVTVTNPTWNGRVVSVHQSDLHDRVTNYQRVAVAATNITPAPGGTAPGDLSDTAGGGYYQLEDASGDYQVEDGSGLYVLEGTAFVYRNLSLQKSQNQDGTVTTYGSLETFEGGFVAGMSFNLTSTNFGISSQPYAITNVTTTFLHATPLYTIEFGDAYQTLQTAGGGVLTQVGSQATIQQGAAVPAGLLGSAQVTANQGSITTAVDLTGLTVTVTVVSGRRIHVTGDVLLQSTVAGDTGWLAILEGATQLRSVQIPLSTSAGSYTARVRVLLTPSVGVHTYKLQAQRLAGTGVVTMVAASTDPATIIVEDIGV